MFLPKNHLFLICICLMIVAGTTGCFNERSPKKPEDNTDWLTPTEPSILIENLQKAISTLNLNNYRRCIATDNFRFKADPTITANNLGLFNAWTWDNETQYFNNLTQAAKPVSSNNSLQFVNTRIINISSDSLELTADYNLSSYHQDTSFQSVTCAGLLSFQMKRNRQNEWQIAGWQDNKTKSTPCWTELRQHFFAP